MQIRKEYRVEYAHRLMNHPGMCRNIHGHSGKVAVVFEGKVQSSTGMIVDFGDLKWAKQIIDIYDHSLVLEKSDPFYQVILDQSVLMKFTPALRLIGVSVTPTAENFCLWIAQDLMQYINSSQLSFKLVSVSFEETPGNSATYYPQD